MHDVRLDREKPRTLVNALGAPFARLRARNATTADVNFDIVTGRVAYRVAFALLVSVAIAGCAKDAGGTAETKRAERRSPGSNGGALVLGSTAYRAGSLANPGTIAGKVTLQGPPPAVTDTVAAADKSSCGESIPDPVAKTNGGLANAVVWIANVEAGKPLRAEKRLDLASEECRLDPRVQAAVIGSTFNVFNDDRLLHRLVFVRFGTHDTLAVMPFFNTGQLVPSERLAKSPGLVEVRCAQHPWTHAYITVFNHPYFAVTKPDGSFRIDSVPAGNYRMMVWHHGAAQPVERSVNVAAGEAANVDVGIALTR